MTGRAIALAAVLLCGCATHADRSRPDAPPPAPLSATEADAIARIEATGRILYEKDIRAATASDLVAPRVNLAAHPEFVGWVTHPNRADYTVSFYERAGASYAVLADVEFDGVTAPLLVIAPDRTPSAEEVSMVRARIAALEAARSPCPGAFNTIVVPGDTPDLWDVYVLAANNNPRLVQVGGHVKVTVSRADGRVVANTPLSKTCLALDKSPPELPEGARPAMLVTTHLLGDLPVATHAYLSLLHRMPLAVGTRRGAWIIESGKIRLLEPKRR